MIPLPRPKDCTHTHGMICLGNKLSNIFVTLFIHDIRKLFDKFLVDEIDRKTTPWIVIRITLYKKLPNTEKYTLG